MPNYICFNFNETNNFCFQCQTVQHTSYISWLDQCLSNLFLNEFTESACALTHSYILLSSRKKSSTMYTENSDLHYTAHTENIQCLINNIHKISNTLAS